MLSRPCLHSVGLKSHPFRLLLRESTAPRQLPCVQFVRRQTFVDGGLICYSSKGAGTSRSSYKHRGKKKSVVEDTEMTELMKIVELLPKQMRRPVESHKHLKSLIEIVMDLGRIPFARFPNGDFEVSKSVVTHEDLDYAVRQLGEFGGDSRAGISGTLHRISCIRNRKGLIIGLTARVGRDVAGSAEMVADIIREGKSVLLLGYPGLGKTTAIRSMCKILADNEKKRVMIVDTSNEIGGDGDVPHPGIGKSRRLQVSHPDAQHNVMIEAVENHMPQVIVIDEIGTEQECKAAATIAQRGVQLIATAHGTGLESIVKNPHLQELIGGVESVTIGDLAAKRRRIQKTILERTAPPAFDVAVEIIDRHSWRVHQDLAEAVDIILAGETAEGEIRTISESGEVINPEVERDLPPNLISPSPKVEAIEEEGEQEEEDDVYSSREWNGESDWNFFHDAVPFSGSESTLSTSSGTTMKLFVVGVESKHIYAILEALGLEGQVAVTPYLKQANAVLGTNLDLEQAEWVETTTKSAGIPLISLQSQSNMSIAKALQALLGLSSSTSSMSSFEQSAPPISEDDVVNSEALDEVRLAIEDIVMPRNQAVDLLPQVPDVIQQQIQMIDANYQLNHETVGEGTHTRLRIFPPTE